MKVLHLVRKSTHLNASFIQNQIVNHIKFLPEVIYLEDRKNMNELAFASTINKDIPIYDLKIKSNLFDKLNYIFLKRISYRKSKELKELIKRIKPDIIHLHYGTDAGIYLPWLKNLKIPKIVSFYGYESSGFPKRFLGLGKLFLMFRTYRLADYIFAMSPDMRNDIISSGCPPKKVIIHYYGSEVKRFLDTRKYQDNLIKKFIIVSGLTPQKGHIFLLESFKTARQFNNQITLTIVGDGPEKDKILNFINNNEMHSYVDVKPFVVYASAEHKQYLMDADVFVHPSLTDVNGDKEGIPGALVEAMAAGLPIISTYHAGIPYIMEDQNTGMLVNERDVSALSNCILKLASDFELRKKIGLNAQRFAIENLDLLSKEKELEDIYCNLNNTKCVEFQA